MAEIKSAIELAMERTKGFRLSAEEKEKFQEEELQSRAQGFVNRLIEMDFNLRELEKELAKYEAQQRGELERLMLQSLFSAIRLDRENEPIFQGIEFLGKAGGGQETIGRIRQLDGSFQEKKESERRKMEGDLRQELERQGISGAAVQPNVEGSPQWAEALAGLNASFQKELQPLIGEVTIPLR